MKFGEFWTEDSGFISKSNCTRDNFLKFFEMRFIPLKKRRDKRPVKKRAVAWYGLIWNYHYSIKSEYYFLGICYGCEYVTDRQVFKYS